MTRGSPLPLASLGRRPQKGDLVILSIRFPSASWPRPLRDTFFRRSVVEAAMRVAIFHDFFPFIGGGERLVLTLARAWNATVYTTEAHPASVERLGFGDVRIVSLGSLIPQPPLKQVHASLRFALARVDADAYVVSGHWAIYAARHNHPNVLYCYTPAPPFYDMRKSLLQKQRSPIHRAIARA